MGRRRFSGVLVDGQCTRGTAAKFESTQTSTGPKGQDTCQCHTEDGCQDPTQMVDTDADTSGVQQWYGKTDYRKCHYAWTGADCSLRTCPRGISWADNVWGNDEGH